MGITTFRRVTASAGAAGLLAAGLLVAAPEAGAAEPGTVTFGYVDPQAGDPVQTWVVPAGVGCLWVEAVGASGAEAIENGQPSLTHLGGQGGVASGPVEVTPGESIEVRVGGAGVANSGGYNGGGWGQSLFGNSSGGGGGATDLRQGGSGLEHRVLVAGGGGGSGSAGSLVAGADLLSGFGGAGGGLTGSAGDPTTVELPFENVGGAGGTQSAGGGGGGVGGHDGGSGGGAGVAGSGGGGGFASFLPNAAAGGGGGGGGWNGGGGGAAVKNFIFGVIGGGGGGGSGHGPSGTVFGVAPNRGNGSLTISYDPAVGSCSGGTLVADHRFLNSSASSAGTLAPVSPVGDGANAFATEPVDGAARPVLQFPAGNGVDLGGLSSELAHRAYTIVMLVRLDEVDGFRRLVNFSGDERDTGLYVNEGHLVFYGRDEQPAGPTTIAPDEWVEVALTRTAAGDLRGYVNGEEQFILSDVPGDAVISDADALRFFRDDLRGEESSGAVARIRLFNGPLGLSQVLGLDRLPAAAKVTRSRATAPQGATVGVSGRRFGPEEQVRVRLRDARGRNFVLATPTVTRQGAFNVTRAIPAGAADGPARLLTRGLTSGLTAETTLRVT